MTDQQPRTLARFFAGLMIVAGALVMGLSGLCTVMLLATSHGDPLAYALGAIFGGVPFLMGLGLLFGGLVLWRGLRLR